LLLLADSAKNTTKNVGFMAAVLVGISQAIAILPGISRSGATISTSVLLGIDRSKAARFSFLMVVPLILGAALLDVKKFKEISELEAMAIEERVDFIMSDLQKDELVSDTEFNSVRMAIYSKEESWDFFKLKGDYAIGRQSEINKSFIVDLDTRVKSLTKDNVSGHHLAKARPLASMGFGVLLAGFLAAFFTGLLACTWMIKLVKKSQLKYFAFYCFLVGAAAISYSLFYV
ncbi:MAG: undecaprenyl pyrophosphate phosphatase UppP, partial [Parvicellaceae bacterium]